jgi:hypothetical protein
MLQARAVWRRHSCLYFGKIQCLMVLDGSVTREGPLDDLVA